MQKLIALMFALLIGMGGAAAVSAQEMDAEFNDQQLELFVDVQSDIEEIRTEYSARLATVEDPEDAAALQEEAGQLMVEAVEDIGLEVATYNNIAFAIQNDPELLERVQSMLN
ncbi:MAG: DUF4168 domain-containing protein [Natronospirillum sp.]